MATEGVSLFYNPDFVETLNSATLAGTLAHEVMHPALHHHVRRSGRDPKRWNVACDFAINPLLVDAGLSLPDGVLFDDGFRGMSAEQIYNLLESESETEQDFGKGGEDDEPGGEESKDETSAGGDSNEPSVPVTEGGIGQVLDAPPPDEENPTIEEQVREWDVAVNQAATVARQAGKVPAGLNRTLEGTAEASVDWPEMLRRLWSDTIAGWCLKRLGHRLLKGMTTANSDVLCQGVADSRDSVATFATHFLRECVASVIVQQAIAQVPETYWKSLGRSHTDQPFGPLLKVCRIFVANSADCAGFADSADS